MLCLFVNLDSIFLNLSPEFLSVFRTRIFILVLFYYSLMAVCPKCGYSLVLLPKRLRFKCAKCGGLYLQKPIDDREFRRWNEKQREFTREEAEIESKRMFEEIWEVFKNANKPERPKLTEEEKRQKQKEHRKRYYQSNREGILRHTKEYYQQNKERIFEKNRIWARNNIEKARRISMEYYYRNKKYLDAKRNKRYWLKKVLALQSTENSVYTPQEGNSSSQMAENYLFNYLN